MVMGNLSPSMARRVGVPEVFGVVATIFSGKNLQSPSHTRNVPQDICRPRQCTTRECATHNVPHRVRQPPESPSAKLIQLNCLNFNRSNSVTRVQHSQVGMHQMECMKRGRAETLSKFNCRSCLSGQPDVDYQYRGEEQANPLWRPQLPPGKETPRCW